MKKKSFDETFFDDYLGCFGNFDIEDPICKKLCAISLRCAIDRNRDIRLELIEDLIASKDMLITIQ